MRVPGQPPVNEKPGLIELPTTAVADTPKLALWLSTFRVYSSGLSFTVQARVPTEADARGLYLGSPVKPHTERKLHLRCVYRGGRVVENGMDFRAAPATPEAPILLSGSSGARDRAVWAEYYLSPLPSAGDALTLVVSYPELELGDVKVRLEGDTVMAALRKCQAMW